MAAAPGRDPAENAPESAEPGRPPAGSSGAACGAPDSRRDQGPPRRGRPSPGLRAGAAGRCPHQRGPGGPRCGGKRVPGKQHPAEEGSARDGGPARGRGSEAGGRLGPPESRPPPGVEPGLLGQRRRKVGPAAAPGPAPSVTSATPAPSTVTPLVGCCSLPPHVPSPPATGHGLPTSAPRRSSGQPAAAPRPRPGRRTSEPRTATLGRHRGAALAAARAPPRGGAAGDTRDTGDGATAAALGRGVPRPPAAPTEPGRVGQHPRALGTPASAAPLRPAHVGARGGKAGAPAFAV